MATRVRERRSFGRIPEVLPLPDLISVQRESFDWLLKQGLKETLSEVSPIEDYQGSMKLYLREHWLEQPKNSVDECQARGLTYSQPLFINAEFINTQTGEIKQQQVFLGDFPVMTDRGTFIINGTERVVVSQLVRSPGVYFEQEVDKTSDRILFRGKVIPGRGAWIELETDKKDMVGIRVDRKRKQPVTVLLTALGYTRPEILDLFEEAESIRLTLEKDAIQTQDEAIIDIYKKLRPGEPQAVDSARNLFESLFFSTKRYDMARVGRHKVDRKLGPLPEHAMHTLERIQSTMPPEKHDWVFASPGSRTLTYEDMVKAVYYMVKLHAGEPGFELDDIDHFGNRRLRSVGELIQNQLRIGFQRMERVVRERMTTQDVEAITPVSLINIRPVTASIREFFGTSQLSQFMDQVNSLSILTHKRRISALGPGGLSRERAGFEVRDVHRSHYGRMCPIETPEGPNIGLIGNLASFAQINEYGFVQTPYRKVVSGKVTEQVDYLTADEEDKFTIAQANEPLDKGKFVNAKVLCRRKGDPIEIPPAEVDYMDVAPHQIVSVATALIPFLEHDDANRALMGANMQRQAVPLVKPRAPYVGTGIEFRAAVDAGDVIVADKGGVVESVDAMQIIVRSDDGKRQTYELRKFRRSNQDTCINQRSIVAEGDTIQAGAVLADGPSTEAGELALGQNLLVGFMPFEGYNFEDAIILSERLVKEDILTSIHIEEYEVDARETKLGPEEVTRDIPNVPEDALKDLDEEGIVRIGAEVVPGDVLVGKVTPKGETELTPEERLLRAIFGEKSREVRDTSLKVPHGEGGIVIGIRKFSRDAGDDTMQPGVNERVHVYVAQKRKISVGDKLAGRHGNKGVIARILPVEDLPHLADGTPVDIILNPHGVPGRMNIGQVLETHLGWVAHNGWKFDEMPEWTKKAGWKASDREAAGPVHFATPVFDGARDGEIFDLLAAARGDADERGRLDAFGKAVLYDGRSGDRFEEPVTVGYTYILKLSHLVDDKIHARSTGPYSMITQQPLGGKAQFGGQRFGEMEVWALEAYGAAYALQELLTIKSDDVNGRVKVYEAIVKGENIPEPGIPESFKVLIKEMQALCLNVDVLSATGEAVQVRDLTDEDGYRAAEELGIDLSRAERARADLEG